MQAFTEAVIGDRPATVLGHRWGWLLALGIVQVIAGCIAIVVPVVASLAATAIFGALLLVTALLQLIHAFKVRAWPRSAWYALGGILYAIGGLLVVAYPLGGALTLAALIAILFIADGTLRVMFGMMFRPVLGWGWLVTAGFCSIVIGVILLIGWPLTALWMTGLLLGVNLIFTGLTNVFLALASRTIASR
ncbi:MAG: HdeD family acid-resistance protein [Steroidobacteraceae bacterium]